MAQADIPKRINRVNQWSSTEKRALRELFAQLYSACLVGEPSATILNEVNFQRVTGGKLNKNDVTDMRNLYWEVYEAVESSDANYDLESTLGAFRMSTDKVRAIRQNVADCLAVIT